MTFSEVYESGKPFRRPHWKPNVFMQRVSHVESNRWDGISSRLVWVSSGDVVDAISHDTMTANDFTFRAGNTAILDTVNRKGMMTNTIGNFVNSFLLENRGEYGRGQNIRITLEVL